MSPKWLPRRPDDLRGLRFARWQRESTAGQADRYGLKSQRRMQDESAEEFDLVDTGLEWTVLKSAWSGRDSAKDPPVTRSEGFRAMVRAAEEGRFDVLLVGYTSRFLRDLTLALQYRRYFLSLGVVIWICDDRILTSDEKSWDRYVDLVKEAEVYSRTQSRNVRAGYRAKLLDARDPGGRAPLGFRRVPFLDGATLSPIEAATLGRRVPKVLEVDPDAMAVVRRMFELAAAGRTDWEVVELTGQPLHTVRTVLNNPLYIGRLQDGNEFRLGATIEIATWNQVQAKRVERRTREPGKVVMRSYALKVMCQGCGAMLHGDTERYRHPVPVCDAFSSARPTVPPVRGRHSSSGGKSYKQDWVEAIAGRVLREVSSTPEALVVAVLGQLRRDPAVAPNQVALARIARQVDEAAQRLAQTRDIAAWQAVMARLDAERAGILADTGRSTEPDPAAVTAYLRDLGALWDRSAARERQELAMALFGSWSFLGFRAARFTWTEHARRHGLDRLVPARIVFDISELGLAGSPSGGFVIETGQDGQMVVPALAAG